MLLLGNGHCFRDYALGAYPELLCFSQNVGGIQKTFEGSSLETIRHMVVSGMGVTALPRTSVPNMQSAVTDLLTCVPFHEPVPDRRAVLAWCKSFTRIAVIEAVAKAAT